MYKHLIIETQESIATVTINRPPVNPLNSEVFQELLSFFEAVNNDDEIRAIILTGSGHKAFVAGADISEMASLDTVGIMQMVQGSLKALDTIENCKKPVIAAINGLALGGGFELALACDLRISTDKAKFAFPEVGLGIIPGGGGTQRLQRIVGQGVAKQLLFLGDMITADQALSYGIVNEVVTSDALLDTAKEWASKLAQKPAVALQVLKEVVNTGANLDLLSGLKFETTAFVNAFSTSDAKEGLTSFLEKRKPSYVGR
ncbi:MAG TPA: enoyl-CoA hydratase-related protein [Ureibacillus sp.]|nr:enoyl-CoA hydratase-related protein [Ureibacillus sp.]